MKDIRIKLLLLFMLIASITFGQVYPKKVIPNASNPQFKNVKVTDTFGVKKIIVNDAYSLPKSSGTSGQVLMKSASDSSYWGTVVAGGSLASTLFVSDSLNKTNAGSDKDGDGTMSKPYATLQKANAMANNKGLITIYVESGNYAPTDFTPQDSLKWVAAENVNVVTTGLSSNTYIWTYTTQATDIVIDGGWNFTCSTSKGVISNTNDNVNMTVNYNVATNSGSATTFVVDGVNVNSTFVKNTHSGSGHNITPSVSAIIVGSINLKGFIYNTGTGYGFYDNGRDVIVNSIGRYEKTTSQNIIYLTGLTEFTHVGKITAPTNAIQTTATDAIVNVSGGFITGNITLTYEGIFNCDLRKGSLSITSTSSTKASRVTINGVCNMDLKASTAGISNIYVNGGTRAYTSSGDQRVTINSGSLGNIYFNGTLLNDDVLTCYGKVYFNGICQADRFVAAANSTVYINNEMTGVSGNYVLRLEASSTVITGQFAKFTGGNTHNIDVNGASAKLISNGGTLTHATKSIECNGNTLSYYGKMILWCKSATNGTITNILTTNNQPITVDANVQ